MITYRHGDIFEANVDALVNPVNTVGVMGAGLALAFKKRFPENMKAYYIACKEKRVKPGKMFITESNDMLNPRWIVNFPTKDHWKNRSKIGWIRSGLKDLRRFLVENGVRSIASPALGAGLGGLPWERVRKEIDAALRDVTDTEIFVYAPRKITPVSALLAETVRRYTLVNPVCQLADCHALAWLLQCEIKRLQLEDIFNVLFDGETRGIYANGLRASINMLDTTFLKADAPLWDYDLRKDNTWIKEPRFNENAIQFNHEETEYLNRYLNDNVQAWLPAVDAVIQLIAGAESSEKLRLLSRVSWLVLNEGYAPVLRTIKIGLCRWPAMGDDKLKWAINRLRLSRYPR